MSERRPHFLIVYGNNKLYGPMYIDDEKLQGFWKWYKHFEDNKTVHAEFPDTLDREDPQ